MQIIAVQVVETLEVALLAIKQLYNVHTSDILCYIGVDTREAHAYGAEVIAHGNTEIRSDPEERGQHDESHQRQLPVDDQQQDGYAEDGEHITKNGDCS